MTEIKKGDQVQLNSGGPIMTVEAFGNYGSSGGIVDGVKCVWYEGSDYKSKIFDRAAIKLVKSS